MTGSEPHDSGADVRGGPHAARHACRQLVAAFDMARTGDVRRRVETSGRLRDAIQAAADLGDLAGLPCPQRVWRAAIHVLTEWERSDDDMRAGALGRAAYAMVGALVEFEAGGARVARPRGGALYGNQREES